MFRLVLSAALVFAVTALSAAPPETASTSPQKVDAEVLDVMLNETSRIFLPIVTEPNDLHACFCISQAIHCAPILAASSGTCTANTYRTSQTHPCILRCARYCLHKAPSSGFCISIKDWLNQKVHHIFREQFFPGTA